MVVIKNHPQRSSRHHSDNGIINLRTSSACSLAISCHADFQAGSEGFVIIIDSDDIPRYKTAVSASYNTVMIFMMMNKIIIIIGE